jgi:hypothetical protein
MNVTTMISIYSGQELFYYKIYNSNYWNRHLKKDLKNFFCLGEGGNEKNYLLEIQSYFIGGHLNPGK